MTAIKKFFSEKLDNFYFEGDLFRNIKTIQKSQNLFDDLSLNPKDWEYGIQAEMNSKPKDYFSLETIINRPFEEADFIQAIKFPFDPKNWIESRFSTGSFGVWYGSLEYETTVSESVYHWRRLLDAAGFGNHNSQIIGERRIYKVGCRALLFDFREKADQFPALIHPEDYSFTQQLGEFLKTQGHPGLFSKSARCEGTISALFTPKILHNPRHYHYLKYSFDPKTQKVHTGINKVPA